jgi:hypothetical protein
MSDRLPEIDFTSIGPPLGERWPDMVLPNQWGQAVDFHERRAGRRGLFVVHRSAGW